jgi:hypothetical protein
MSASQLFSFFSKIQARSSQEEKISASQPPENATARRYTDLRPEKTPAHRSAKQHAFSG